MSTIKYLGFAGLAAAGLFATQAFATTCPAAPGTGTQTQGSPVCIAPVGTDGAGTGLQDLLDGITKPGTPNFDVYHGQTSPSAYWSTSASGLGENRIMFEIAGYANSNSFGIFDPTDPTNRLQLFGGSASHNAATTLMWNGDGSFTATYLNGNGQSLGTADASFGATNLFGYYLDNGHGEVFFSVLGLNSDGTPHMVAYQGNGQTKLDNVSTGQYATFGTSDYILAWEDLPFSRSDMDYNDFVVMVESVHPVPEPASLGVFGLGVLLLGAAVGLHRRRRFNIG
jgi:hypothetical protein